MNIAEPERKLCRRKLLVGCLEIPLCCQPVVEGHALPVLVQHSQAVLRLGVSLIGSPAVPLGRLLSIFRNMCAELVFGSDEKLGFLMARGGVSQERGVNPTGLCRALAE